MNGLPLFDAPRMPTLRPYQLDTLRQLQDAWRDGYRAPLAALPTGAGKTVIAAELVRRELDAGGSAVFLAPRRELVHQASRAFANLGIEHGVLLAGAEAGANAYARAQVGSVNTLISRMIRRRRLDLVSPSLVIVDEAHLNVTERRKELLDLWPNARRVGFTATPTRKDGRALGMLYDTLLEPCTTASLVEQGYLVRARYFTLSAPDLQRVRIVAGDFHQGDLNAAVNKPELVGDIVEHVLRLAPERRAAVFACSIAHSAALAEAFLRAGVAAEHVNADTPRLEREATFARFSRGDTQVLCNVLLAAYGFDLPELDCVVLARPTKSEMLFLQMIGRGLRIAPGKSDCLVLDHSGCVHRFGFAHDERRWTLAGKHALVPPAPTSTAAPAKARRILEGPECHAAFSGSRVCPECGYAFPTRGREVQTLDGELVEVGTYLEPEERERLAFYLELRGYAHERGYQAGFAAHKFRERHGEFPPWRWKDLPAAQPSLSTRRWVLSRQIAYAKASEAQRRAGAC